MIANIPHRLLAVYDIAVRPARYTMHPCAFDDVLRKLHFRVIATAEREGSPVRVVSGLTDQCRMIIITGRVSQDAIHYRVSHRVVFDE